MIWRPIGALAAIVALGAVAGQVASGGPDPVRSFRVGGATLGVSGDWRQVDANTLTDGRQHLRVTLGALEQPSRTSARLGGYHAWAHGTSRILPTTRGALTVDCRCPNAVRSVSVPGAAILTPAPDLALRLRAPKVFAALDAIRTQERNDWTPASAARLAAAHRTALAALGPLATPALREALDDAAGAYDTLTQTPTASPAELTASDRALDAAVAALAREGAPGVQQATAAPASGGVSLTTLALILATAVLISALAPATLRRLRRPRPAAAAEEGAPAKVCPRRKPIVPPPTYGRWNEAPRGPGAAQQEDGAPSITASSSTA